MKRRFTATSAGLLPLVLALAAAPVDGQQGVQQQGGSVITDLLKRAGDAFNDLKYLRADSLARQVLVMPRLTTPQRTLALLVIAAAAYPEEASAQKPATALSTLKQIVRTNFTVKIPQELTWSGLDSLLEVAKRTTFGIEVSGDSEQVVVGTTGQATLRVRANRTGTYSLTVIPADSGSGAIFDSLPASANTEFQFAAMRNERPIFTSGTYSVIISAMDPASHDTVTVRYNARVEAPALEFVTIPAKMDSSKLLPVRSGRFGFKSVIPAIMVGGAVFALSNVLRGEGDIATAVDPDSKGVAIAGGVAVTTLLAGFLDRGRPLPANIAANKAFGEAWQKGVQQLRAENRRRITEYRTTFHFELEAR